MDELLDPSGIAEVGGAAAVGLGDGLLKLAAGSIGEKVLVAAEQAAGYLHELRCVVVVELVLIGEAPCESGVGGEHGVHLLLVSGEDNQQVRIGLREHGEQTVDDACTEVLAVARAVVEVIGLVDEEDVAACLLEHGFHILFGLANETSDELCAVGGDDVALGEQTQGSVYLARCGGRVAGVQDRSGCCWPWL